MIRQFKGTSPLALLADGLPVRTRIGLAVIAAELALDRLRSSADLPIGEAGFDLARRWFDGQRFNPDAFADVIDPEEPSRGTPDCEREAKSEDERSAWAALDIALAYTAFHAYGELGQWPMPSVADVDERALDDIDQFLRLVSPDFMKTMQKAANYLKEKPGVLFAELKSMISECASDEGSRPGTAKVMRSQ